MEFLGSDLLFKVKTSLKHTFVNKSSQVFKILKAG